MSATNLMERSLQIARAHNVVYGQNNIDHIKHLKKDLDVPFTWIKPKMLEDTFVDLNDANMLTEDSYNTIDKALNHLYKTNDRLEKRDLKHCAENIMGYSERSVVSVARTICDNLRNKIFHTPKFDEMKDFGDLNTRGYENYFAQLESKNYHPTIPLTKDETEYLKELKDVKTKYKETTNLYGLGALDLEG